MPPYLLPGIKTSRRTTLTTGFVALATVSAMTMASAVVLTGDGSDPTTTVSILAADVGDGVTTGSAVTLDGVRIGEVAGISNASRGVQRLSLDLTGAHDLTERLSMTYTPSNLFGITTVALTRGDNGSRLRSGAVVDLTGPRAGRVVDATMGALLHRSSTMSTTVATADMSRLVYRMSSDLRGFTPFLQSMVALAQTAVDKRRMSPAQLLDSLGSATESTTILFDATVQVIDRVYKIDVLRTDRDRIRAGLDIVTGQLFPTLGSTMRTAGAQFGDLTGLLVPPLRALTRGTTPLSADKMSRLLAQLRTAMPGTPAGPVLAVDVVLAQTPAVSQSLMGAQGGRR